MAAQRRRSTQQPSGVPGRGYVPPASQQPVRQQPYQQWGTGNGPYIPSAPVRQGETSSAKRKKRKNLLIWLVIAVLVILMVEIGVSVRRMEEEKAAARQRAEEIHTKVASADGVFCSGVDVDGIHLGGMTPQQAKEAVEAQVQ